LDGVFCGNVDLFLKRESVWYLKGNNSHTEKGRRKKDKRKIDYLSEGLSASCPMPFETSL